jgi:hypothetical protein
MVGGTGNDSYFVKLFGGYRGGGQGIDIKHNQLTRRTMSRT